MPSLELLVVLLQLLLVLLLLLGKLLGGETHHALLKIEARSLCHRPFSRLMQNYDPQSSNMCYAWDKHTQYHSCVYVFSNDDASSEFACRLVPTWNVRNSISPPHCKCKSTISMTFVPCVVLGTCAFHSLFGCWCIRVLTLWDTKSK